MTTSSKDNSYNNGIDNNKNNNHVATSKQTEIRTLNKKGKNNNNGINYNKINNYPLYSFPLSVGR